MTDTFHEDQSQTHIDRLVATVRRGRRVESHSLVQDLDQLLSWASQQFRLVTVDGVTHLRQDFPPVEQLESLAARVRPFILNDDAIYYTKVLRSLGYFLRGNEHFIADVATLRRGWSGTDRTNREPLGQVLQVIDGDGSSGPRASYRKLAYAWLYADLVHASEEERLAVEGFGPHERYRAGAALVTLAAVQVVATMNLIRQAVEAGLLALPTDVLTEDIDLEPVINFPLIGAVAGQPGTPIEDLQAVLDTRTTQS